MIVRIIKKVFKIPVFPDFDCKPEKYNFEILISA
jgi:hypothetical protein